MGIQHFLLEEGFLKYNQKMRINLGIFYDVINAENSPFRPATQLELKKPDRTGSEDLTYYLSH